MESWAGRICWVTIITRNQSSASIIITLQFLGQQWKHLVRLGSLQLEWELKWKTWDFWDNILVGEDSLADVWCLNVRQLTSWCDEIGKQLVGNQMSRVIILAQIKKSSKFMEGKYCSRPLTDVMMLCLGNPITIKTNKIEILSLLGVSNARGIVQS